MEILVSSSSSSSCSTLHNLQVSKVITSSYGFHYATPRSSNPRSFPSISSLFPRNSYFPGKRLQFDRLTAFSSPIAPDNQNPPPELAVLLEVEGVLMDVYRLANRQTFNAAFKKLGLDCANWTEPIYADLVRKSAGDEERMLTLFFNRIGWPTSLPTNEKEQFMKSVLREKKNALEEFVMSESLPLRPGVEDFLDDAYRARIPVVIVTAYSRIGDKIARFIIERLGHERISKVKVVGNKEVEESLYSELVLGKGVSSGLDEELAKEAKKAASAQKQRIAKEVASMLKLSVEIDTSSTESLENIVATLCAGAKYAGVPVSNCVLVAGSQSGVAGAERISMPCVVVRSSVTARAEFPSAKAVMDGFGGADLTISRLCQKLAITSAQD